MRLATLSLTLSALLASLPAADARDIPFEQAAKEFLSRHGLGEAKPSELGVDLVLAKGFAHARIGLFEVWFPISGMEKSGDDIEQCCASLVDAQVALCDWLDPVSKEAQKPVRADAKVVGDWIKSWRLAPLARPDAAGQDLLELAGAGEAVVQASARFGEALLHGVPFGGAAPGAAAATEAGGKKKSKAPVPVRLYLMPTRKDFVEFSCFVGLAQPKDRAKFWLESAGDWTQYHVGKDQAIALEYASPRRKNGEYEQGFAMNTKNPMTMRQQVVQLALNSLFERFYEGRVPPAFAQGLSMNLVIDLFGEIHSRVDGDMRSRTTGAREMFVPGGIDNGVLPVASAESRWREDHGKDRFIRVLRLAQKEGEGLDKKSKNRLAAFGLVADDGVARTAVAAPFLGSAAAAGAAPPAEFKGDYDELLRSYKSGFLYWLQNKAGGGERPSREKFATLLAKLAEPSRKGGFEAVFGEVYDQAPLSGPDANKDTLEGKFLVWLSKQ